MTSTLRLLPFVLLVSLTACDAERSRVVQDASAYDDFIPATTLDCEDGQSVRALYPDRKSVDLTIDGETHRLKITASGSGARYTGGGLQWWSKGDEAMLAALGSGEEIAIHPGVRCAPRTSSRPDDRLTGNSSGQVAAAVVETYFALVESGRTDAASRLRADGMRQDLGSYLTLGAQVGAPGRVTAAAGSLYVDVPVSIYGRHTSGEAYLKGGKVVLRRAEQREGTSADARRWRIVQFRLETYPSALRPTR